MGQRKLNPRERRARRAHELHEAGRSLAEIAAELGVTEATAQGYLDQPAPACFTPAPREADQPDQADHLAAQALDPSWFVAKERMAKVVALRVMGYSEAEIAGELDMPVKSVNEDLTAAKSDGTFGTLDVQLLRFVDLQRLDRLTRAHMPWALGEVTDPGTGEKIAPQVANTDRVLAIIASRQKILDAVEAANAGLPEPEDLDDDALRAELDTYASLVAQLDANPIGPGPGS